MDNALVQLMKDLENNEALDGVVAAAQPLMAALTGDDDVRALLQGEPAGHAAHPALVLVPIGTWLSASALDLLGGDEGHRAAQRLTGLGILAAIPSALTGWAELATASKEQQRVGVVHAGVNAGALVLQIASWRARRRGQHRRGAALGLAANTLAGVGGYLGGHMSVVREVGTRHPGFDH